MDFEFEKLFNIYIHLKVIFYYSIFILFLKKLLIKIVIKQINNRGSTFVFFTKIATLRNCNLKAKLENVIGNLRKVFLF